MFAELMRAEWDRRRALLAVLCLVFAAGPLQYLQLSGEHGLRLLEKLSSAEGQSAMLGVGMAVLAACWGAGAWTPERRGRWVYALSLPVGRVRYFAARYAVSLLWLAVPVAALGAASLAVAAWMAVPGGMYAYPLRYTAWMALLAWVVFSLAFVLAARFENPTRALVAPLAVLVVLGMLSELEPFQGLRPVMEYARTGAYSPFRMFDDYPNLVGF